uniref:Uncharacterized protein n=1 Tax=Heterorhabditis bacteriophora TaxID=37862 RepID=A0A1I7X1D2_HETBA
MFTKLHIYILYLIGLHLTNAKSIELYKLQCSNIFVGIHSFLQPKNRAPTSMSRSTGRFSKSATRLTENNEEAMDLLSTNESVPVGKQTVAEAARQCGSSLHLYRNPLESETEEENESDSLEGKEVTGV